MTKGTMHEGKYEKTPPVITQPDEGVYGAPGGTAGTIGAAEKPVKTDLGDMVKEAEPAILLIVGMRILSSPAILLILFIFSLVMAAKIDAFITGLGIIYTRYPFFSGAAITIVILLIIKAVIKR